MTRTNKNNSFAGSILEVRHVEDSIRATGKYTEGIFTALKTHPLQGNDFPSKVFNKYYEVYPSVDLNEVRGWDVVGVTIDWLWGDIPRIHVTFRYDYRSNRAWIVVKAGNRAIEALGESIPGFKNAMEVIIANDGSPESK